ncbi:MAG: ATP-binding protein [Nitrososphaeria archaeon]
MRYEVPDKIFAPTLIAPSGGYFTTDHIKIGNTYYTTVVLVQYPREVSIGWFNDLLNLPLDSRIAIYIEGVKHDVFLKKLQKRYVQAQGTNLMRQEQGQIPDFESTVIAEDIAGIMQAIAEGKEKLVNTYVFITLSSPTLDGLEKDLEYLVQKLSSANIEFRRMIMQAKEGFYNTLPNISPVGSFLPSNIEPATAIASMFPFSIAEINDEFKNENDIRIIEGINVFTNSLVLIDPFKNQNGNTVVLGKTRSGKSFYVKNTIMQLLTQGVEVIVIDPLAEYCKMADAINDDNKTSAIVSFSMSGSYILNPFDIYTFADEDPKITFSEKKEFLISLIEIMVNGELNAEEKSVVAKAITNTYKRKGITEENLKAKEMPTMKDFYNELVLGESFAEFGQRKNIAQKIAEKIERYVEGKYATFFTGQTNINPVAPFVVFDISKVANEENTTFKNIAYYIILNYLWKRTRSRNVKKPLVLVLDEAKLFMDSDQIRRIISGIVGKIAKYNASVYLISQSVKDFGTTIEGTRIVAQCGLKVLFSQDPVEVEEVIETFGLTNYEAEAITKTVPGQALFIRDDMRILVKIVAPDFLKPLITTDPGRWTEWAPKR